MAFPYCSNMVEQCQISPPSGSVLPASIPITIFDVLWLPLPPVQRLFFYEHRCSKDHFMKTFLPNIKHSLSLALQHFFPLAGNLIWPQDSSRPEILYKDGYSVSFTVNESDYDWDVLLSNHPKDASAFDPLVPELINSPAEKRFPLTSFIVTLFPNKGFSIGIAYNHAVADGRAILHFIKTWASICQSQQVNSTSMIDGSPLIQPPCINKILVKEDSDGYADLAVSDFLEKANFTRNNFYASDNRLAGTDKIFSTFVMSHAEINRLKQWVLANKQVNAPSFQLSTYVLTCAYVWVCLIKARWPESVIAGTEEDQTEYFVFVVDCRARLDPPLPATYFGSSLILLVVEAKVSELTGEKGIPIAAELIGNAIREINNGSALLKHMEWVLSYVLKLLPPERFLSVAGSAKLGTYDTDFGWGKPKKSEIISIATSGALSLAECPSEVGAVEIGLARVKVEMEAFTSLYASTMQSLPPCM